jgi:hypothetical protein
VCNSSSTLFGTYSSSGRISSLIVIRATVLSRLRYECKIHYLTEVMVDVSINVPIPMAARYKAWVCGRSLAGIVGSNSAGGMNICLL